MSRTISSCLRAAGPLALLCAVPLAAAGGDPRPQPSPTPRAPVRVYTNEDLERVHPFAAQTGARSIPAYPAAGPEAAAAPREQETRGRGESYWRRQAAALRERLRALEERAAGLRSRIAEHEQRRKTVVYGRGGRAGSQEGSDAPLRAQLQAVERRMRRTQEDLEDRARRDGALPGWLR